MIYCQQNLKFPLFLPAGLQEKQLKFQTSLKMKHFKSMNLKHNIYLYDRYNSMLFPFKLNKPEFNSLYITWTKWNICLNTNKTKELFSLYIHSGPKFQISFRNCSWGYSAQIWHFCIPLAFLGAKDSKEIIKGQRRSERPNQRPLTVEVKFW